MIKTIAILDEYKGRGVGNALVKDCIANFESNDISVICSIAWRSKKGINVVKKELIWKVF